MKEIKLTTTLYYGGSVAAQSPEAVTTNSASDEAAVSTSCRSGGRYEGRDIAYFVPPEGYEPFKPNPLEAYAYDEIACFSNAELSQQFGGGPSGPGHVHACAGEPVSCATGNFSEQQTDLTVGGRGVGLNLTRTYNSQAAAEGTKGSFGYGWSSSFGDHLVVNKSQQTATLDQADGSTVPFSEGSGSTFTAPSWSQDKLSGNAEVGYTLTYPDQTQYRFGGSSGRLERLIDRNGNTTTLSYNGSGQLEAITDPAGRKMTLAYNGEGLVRSAKDPMGHEATYTYEGGSLASVTLPGESTPRWQFKYDGAHEAIEVIDGRAGKTLNTYNAQHQVSLQRDPAGRTLTFTYEHEPFVTKIENQATGSLTIEPFTASYEPAAITHTAQTLGEHERPSTETFTYDSEGNVRSSADGNNHATIYTYDTEGNRTSTTDADGDETKWTYNTTHDVITTTTPNGETTTIRRDGHGNAEAVERPAPGGKTQITKYTYSSRGDVETMTDPLERTWKYVYDPYGDRSAEIDAEGDKRTWFYDEDSRERSSVSPRGNVAGAKAAEFTTTIERDAQGRAKKVTDPLGHETKYTYDRDGNVETLTDANGHTTTYTYNADNEQTAVHAPNGDISETGYDAAGHVISQTDGNHHTTEYVRNKLGQVARVIDPLARATVKEYDDAGNLASLTDAAGRTTTFKYDPANRVMEVSYSDGKTHAVKYEYDKDGARTKMEDATGTSKYVYDQLDRLTESETGHKEVVKYGYDLANEKTAITYPSGKAIARDYDRAGRLKSVTDWDNHQTRFFYEYDGNLAGTLFPTETADEDLYEYDAAEQMHAARFERKAQPLALTTYTRDNDGQVILAYQKGLPSKGKIKLFYDEDNRLKRSGRTAYIYDSANNPTKIGKVAYSYNSADELETGKRVTFAYDAIGERTQLTASFGGVTKYGYDEAGNLVAVVNQPSEGPATEDSYTYDGAGLRASQTASGVTSYLTWDAAEAVPLVLSDGASSYIYGPGALPIEQINNATGAVEYLHHDQQGSTRLITGPTGTTEGTYTFDAYGNQLGHAGSATTALGYDGQYTNQDTGLIYLRGREYDPVTGQFLSVDPLVSLTDEPYVYAGTNPVTYRDRSGLGIEEIFEGGSGIPCPWCSAAQGAAEALEGAYHEAQHGIEWVSNQLGTEELGEPLEQGVGAAEKGCELLEKDKSGKVHGEIPTHPNPEWTEEDLEQVAEDLRDSIEQRKQKLGELGEEPGHRNKLGEQERFLRQIEKKLSGS